MKRLLIFSHFSPDGEFASHVLYTLKTLCPLFNRVILVSNTSLSPENKYTLTTICHKIIESKDNGFDLGAWKDALLEEGWNTLTAFDNITLMNDTCFGPLCDMVPVYGQMETNGIDFWSITNILGNNQQPEKRQINFLAFNSQMIQSSIFKDFWNSVDYSGNKNKFKHFSKICMIDNLISLGFLHKVHWPTSPAHGSQSWQFDLLSDVHINHICPFIRVHTFSVFNNPNYLKKMIAQKTDYPTNLIDDFCSRIYPPNTSIKIANKVFNLDDQLHTQKVKRTPASVALHLHVFYIDVFKTYLAYLKKINRIFDLYITTDTDEKKKHIISLLIENSLDGFLKGLYVLDNHGRDILPWIKISNILHQYSIVGHFHTKKSATVQDWIGSSWQSFLLDTLIRPMDKIIQLFENQPELGIVIPDVPHYFSAVLPKVDAWGINKLTVTILWDKMKCKKHLEWKYLPIPVMSYGNMFWYRPEALRPLFDLNLADTDFPKEPLPVDGTIAYAIERLPVYLAWNEGYDFRIAINPADRRTEFEFLSQITESGNYRLGSWLLRVPRIIYNRSCRLFGHIK